MPHARNAAPEDKAHAVLALAEYCVRDDVGPDDCSEYDRLFMDQSAEILCKDLNVLRKQAQAQSTNAWRKVLGAAHSMRCVTINRDTKDEQRQCMFRCDGCGRQEKWCGLGIDLAGERYGVKPSDWLDTASVPSARWPALFRDFHTGYQKDIRDPERCDMGRFYLGKTCHRKAQLSFIANTMVQETLYNARQMLVELPILPEPTELHTVDDEAPQEFIDRKDQLELCIADERRGDMPDVMVDGGFWDNIDEHRLGLTPDEIGSKATATLNRMGGTPASRASEDQMSDDDDDEFVVSADDGEEEDENLAEIEEESDEVPQRDRPRVTGRWRRAGAASAVDDGSVRSHEDPRPPKKRNRVIEDDDEEDELPPVAVMAQARPPRARTHKGDAPPRRSRRQQHLSPDKEVAVVHAEHDEPLEGQEEAGEESDEEVLVSSLSRSNAAPLVARNAIERRGAPPSAIEVARNMRIPRNGTPGQLPSRQAVLLGLINVQRDLIIKRENGLAAQVGAAVITMQELLEIAERSRVGQ